MHGTTVSRRIRSLSEHLLCTLALQASSLNASWKMASLQDLIWLTRSSSSRKQQSVWSLNSLDDCRQTHKKMSFILNSTLWEPGEQIWLLALMRQEFWHQAATAWCPSPPTIGDEPSIIEAANFMKTTALSIGREMGRLFPLVTGVYVVSEKGYPILIYFTSSSNLPTVTSIVQTRMRSKGVSAAW